jgi:hypothetical protein
VRSSNTARNRLANLARSPVVSAELKSLATGGDRGTPEREKKYFTSGGIDRVLKLEME